MHRSFASLVLASLALFLLSSRAAHAQVESSVSGTGLVTLQRQPDLLRMQMEIAADGKTLQEALDKLKAKREAAKAKLQAMGVADAALEVGQPTIGSIGNDRRSQMERMVRMRMNNGNRPAPTSQPGPSVSVSLSLKAEWPLTGKSGDQLLLAAYDLQEKVKAADLAQSGKTGKPRTPEEEEMAEEMNGMGGPDQSQQQPGEPLFMYVSKLADADRAKAVADAFQKAKVEAGQLAKAAGMSLGALRNLNSQAAPDMSQFNDYGDPYSRYFYNQQFSSQRSSQEAIAPKPGPVTVNVTVMATFTLKSGE